MALQGGTTSIAELTEDPTLPADIRAQIEATINTTDPFDRQHVMDAATQAHFAEDPEELSDAQLNIFSATDDPRVAMQIYNLAHLGTVGNVDIGDPEKRKARLRGGSADKAHKAALDLTFQTIINDINDFASNSFSSLFDAMGGNTNQREAYEKILNMTAEEYMAWFKEHDDKTFQTMVDRYKQDFPDHGLTDAQIELKIAEMALEQAQEQAKIGLAELDQRILNERTGSFDFGAKLASKIFADDRITSDESDEMQAYIEKTLEQETIAFEALKVELVDLEKLQQDVIALGGTPSEGSKERIQQLQNGIIAQEHMTNAKVRFYAILEESRPDTTPTDLMKAVAKAELDKDYSANADQDPSSATIMESFQFVHGENWIEHFTQYAAEFGLPEEQVTKFLGFQGEIFGAAQTLKEYRANFENPDSPLMQIGNPSAFVFEDDNGGFQTSGVDFVDGLTPASPELTNAILNMQNANPSLRIGTVDEAKEYAKAGEQLSNAQIKEDVIAIADAEATVAQEVEDLTAPEPEPDLGLAKVTMHKAEIAMDIVRSGGVVTTDKIAEYAEKFGIPESHIKTLTADLAAMNEISVVANLNAPISNDQRVGVLASMPDTPNGITPTGAFANAADPQPETEAKPEPAPAPQLAQAEIKATMPTTL